MSGKCKAQNVITGDLNALVSAGDAARGQRSEEQLKTAKKHFNSFLVEHGDQNTSQLTVDTLVDGDVDAELIGRFATYLFTKLKKLSGAQAYLSQIKVFFSTKWQGNPNWALHPTNCSDQWYGNIRAGLKRMFTNRAIAEGESLVDQAPPMYRDALRQVARYLFWCNTSTSLEERDLIITQWHCMGRAGETGIRHSAVRFIGAPTSVLQFAIGRSKTSSVQYIHAFCDAVSWEHDIFHAKACHLITSRNVDDDYHFRGSSPSIINGILSRVCANAQLEERYQSHSGRRGCATEALSHNGVSVAEVSTRGGWAYDAISRVFLYFCGVDRGDMRVGRVVAGWPESNSGGIPASHTWLQDENQQKFEIFAKDLLRKYLHIHSPKLLFALVASAVMYYNDIVSDASLRSIEPVVIVFMRESIQRVGYKECMLHDWSSTLRRQWLVANLPNLSTDSLASTPIEMQDAITVSYPCFKEVLDRQSKICQELTLEMMSLKKSVADNAVLLVEMNNQMRLCLSNQQQMMALMSTAKLTPAPTQKTHVAIVPKRASPTSTEAATSCSLPTSLAGIRASCLVMDFITNQWETITPSAKQKEVLRKTRLVVQRFKDFFSPDYVLHPPPAPHDPAYALWYADLHVQVATAEKRMLEYIDSIKPRALKRKRTHLMATSVNRDLANTSSRGDYPSAVSIGEWIV